MNKKDLCKNIQNNVSKLTNIEIIELFKIILKTGENYTKNNNGVFINLNCAQALLFSYKQMKFNITVFGSINKF